MNFKKINPFWNLADSFTVMQAAAIIAGFDPDSISNDGWYFKDTETGITDSDGISYVKTAFNVLCNAINNGKLKATMRHSARSRDFDEYPSVHEGVRILEMVREGQITPDVNDCIFFCKEPDWDRTTIDRQDLKDFLSNRGFHVDFFFHDDATDTPEYLNPDHPRYAPKLAAAIHAWVAVGNEEKMKGKTPKQALEKELRETAAKFGLTNEDGNPIQNAIEECSKVANWNPGGGAPKMPG